MNRKIYTRLFALLTCLSIGLLTGCSSSSKTYTISLSTVPSTAPTSLYINDFFTITATTNDTAGVTWSCAPAGSCGTFSSATSLSGVAVTYTAPATVPSGTVTITATSVTKTSVTASLAPITINPASGITITLSGLPGSLVESTTASVTATVANDTANGGVTWSCAPAGSCGSFSPNSSASGAAVTYTAPSTTGSVTITATSVSDDAISASQSVSITGQVTTANYVFFASGYDGFGGIVNYYAIAGAVTIDSTGNVIAGEQDYNDADGLTSPEPSGDTITGGTMTVDATTGVGTLTLITNNANVGGLTGTEIFAVQFANSDHAFISEFDGSATSSGSLDLQTSTSPSGNFAFALSGVDPSYLSYAVGGVFNATAGSLSGTYDFNDEGTVTTFNTLTATSTTPDSFGRSTITGINPITFVAYGVHPEVMRIIDVDTTDSAVGSAYGQASATFDNTSLGSSVFGLEGQWSSVYGTLGSFQTDTAGNITGGVADDNELSNNYQQIDSPISGTYDLVTAAINGYGTVSLTGANNVTTLGIYMVDPTLNINDPNNTGGAVGGALIMDQDGILPGGIGFVVPQTDTSTSSFTGSYAAGFQDYNYFVCAGACELDMVGPFTMTAGGSLSTVNPPGAEDSDPFGTWSGTPAESTGDTFSSTPLSIDTGVYNMYQLNTPANPLSATIDGIGPGVFDADIYQASGAQLYWLEFDNNSMFFGPIEQQGSLAGVPAHKKATGQAQPKQNIKPIKGLGGSVDKSIRGRSTH